MRVIPLRLAGGVGAIIDSPLNLAPLVAGRTAYGLAPVGRLFWEQI